MGGGRGKGGINVGRGEGRNGSAKENVQEEKLRGGSGTYSTAVLKR
jgi:hypothetical protein